MDDRKEMVSWVKASRQRGNGREIPPAQMVAYEDLLKMSWGWNRLVPCDPTIDLRIYINYLEKYYMHNDLGYLAISEENEHWPLQVDHLEKMESVVGNETGLIAAASFCLEREKVLMSLWKALPKHQINTMPSMILLSGMIQVRARLVVTTGGEFSDLSAAAFVCIGKEAELLSEMLRLNANISSFERINAVRMCAYHLMSYKGYNSTALAATMVGMAKEAKMMSKWMRKRNELIVLHSPYLPYKIVQCSIIRGTTFDLMACILDDYFNSDFASIAVAKSAKVDSSSEIALDDIRNGTAAAKSTGGNNEAVHDGQVKKTDTMNLIHDGQGQKADEQITESQSLEGSISAVHDGKRRRKRRKSDINRDEQESKRVRRDSTNHG